MLQPDYKQQKKLFLTLGILVFIGIILGILKLTVLKTNEVTEESLRATYYEASKGLSSDEKQRQIIVNCLVDKLKARYGGNLERLDIDSLKNISDGDAEACAKLFTKISWTPLIEEKILKKFSSLEELNGFSAMQKMDYAQCLLSKLKIKYPKGLDGRVPEKEMDEFYMGCVSVLKARSKAK